MSEPRAPAGRDDVEVAHEALIRHWPRLRGWLDEDRAGLALRDSVRDAALEWERRGRDESYLVHRGSRLEEVDGLRRRKRPTLNALESEYIGACIALRTRTEARHRRLRTAIVAGSVAVAIIASVLAGWALIERSRAEHQVVIARIQAMVAQALRQHDLGQDERGALLARQAYLTSSDPKGPEQDWWDRATREFQEVLGIARREDGLRTQIDEALRGAVGIPRFSRILTGHDFPVLSIAFAPDGETLATVDDRGTVLLWDLALHSRPVELPEAGLNANSDAANSSAFGPDGRTLIVADNFGRVARWDVRQPMEVAEIVIDDDSWPGGVAVSTDGRAVAGGDETEIRLWKLDSPNDGPVTLTGVTTNVFASSEWIATVAISSDGNYVAATGSRGSAWLWHREAPADPTLLDRGENRVGSLAFSPDGQTLAGAFDDGTIRQWTLSNGSAPAAILTRIETAVLGLAFSPGGRALAIVAHDQTVRIWGLVENSDAPVTLPGGSAIIESAAFSQDGRMLAAGYYDAGVWVWDLQPSDAVPLVLEPNDSEYKFSAIAYAPDGRFVVTGAVYDGTVARWDLTDIEVPSVRLFDLAGGVKSLVYGPEGRTVAAGDSSGNVGVWTVADPDHPRLFPPMPDMVLGLAIGPGEHTLAAGSRDGTIWLWNLDRPDDAPQELAGTEPISVQSLAFSHDGGLLAVGGCFEQTPGDFLTCSNSGVALVWDLERPTDNPVELRPSYPTIRSVSFGGDGRMLAAGDESGSVWLWELGNLRERPIELRVTTVTRDMSVAFTRDGRFLAASGCTGEVHIDECRQGTVRLWDMADPSLNPLELTGAGWSSTSLAFSPDGKRLAALGDDGKVRVMVARSEVLADLVCSQVWRNLTEEEWDEFVGPDVPYDVVCPNLTSGEGVPTEDLAAAANPPTADPKDAPPPSDGRPQVPSVIAIEASEP